MIKQVYKNNDCHTSTMMRRQCKHYIIFMPYTCIQKLLTYKKLNYQDLTRGFDLPICGLLEMRVRNGNVPVGYEVTDKSLIK